MAEVGCPAKCCAKHRCAAAKRKWHSRVRDKRSHMQCSCGLNGFKWIQSRKCFGADPKDSKLELTLSIEPQGGRVCPHFCSREDAPL